MVAVEEPDIEPSERTNPNKRMRWATQRTPGKQGVQKRMSILKRHVGRLSGNNGDFHDEATQAANEHRAQQISNDEDLDGQPPRTVYFNRDLPKEARDEEGRPKQSFKRNKIRTAKYTPLSFIPKNLWFQLHNIANVYFIFIVILGVRNFKTIVPVALA
jgi:phospholipid-translocating ATPase